jgi:hypothetical protein
MANVPNPYYPGPGDMNRYKDMPQTQVETFDTEDQFRSCLLRNLSNPQYTFYKCEQVRPVITSYTSF